jgi:DNA primase
MANNQIEDIKQKIDIVTFIGERVPLTKSGRNHKGLCPFHGEKSPSFFVSPDMQMFKCFGCQASGDVISFVQQYEGLEFPEALQLLADRAGVRLEKTTPSSVERQTVRIQEILHQAAEYYHFILTKHPVGKKALHYLKERQITNQSITNFMLGYASDSWDSLHAYLVKKKKYTPQELVDAGLAIKSDQGRTYDRFRGRIIFPQTTFAGKIVGFSGRLMEKDPKEAKYINSPETSLYHKSKILYGMTQAKRTIKEKNRIIVVEGEFDVISCHQIGLKEVVAIKGSALTTDHAQLIRRLTHNVVLALDSDAAGQEAMRRGIDVCEAQGLDLRIAKVSDGKDPDDLARANPSQLKQDLKNTISIYDYLIDLATSDITPTSSGEAKHHALQTLIPVFNRIDSAVKKEAYLKKIATKLNTSISSISQEMEKAAKMGQFTPAPVQKTESPKTLSRQELLERQAIGLSLHTTTPDEFLLRCIPDWFSQPHINRLITSLTNQLDTLKPPIKGVDLVNHLPNEMKILAQQTYALDDNWFSFDKSQLEALIDKTIKQLEMEYLKRRLNELSKQMATADSSQVTALQTEYRQISQKRSQLEGGRDQVPSV